MQEVPLERNEDVVTGTEYQNMIDLKVPYTSSWNEELGLVKVTVKLCPKSPYNADTIVSTRTFKPTFIRRQ